MEFVYAITCKRSIGDHVDYYVVNPVYANENTAYEKLEECREKYSMGTDKMV